MNEQCSRRAILHFCTFGVISGIAGCSININLGGTDEDDDERGATLDIHPNVERAETGWQMDIRVRNTTSYDFSIHDVTVVAFSKQKEEVCWVEMGDFPQGDRWEESKTITCVDFPAIITATAEESPCDGSNIQIAYLSRIIDEYERFAWDNTFRECNEPLVPDRVIEKIEEVPEHE